MTKTETHTRMEVVLVFTPVEWSRTPMWRGSNGQWRTEYAYAAADVELAKQCARLMAETGLFHSFLTLGAVPGLLVRDISLYERTTTITTEAL